MEKANLTTLWGKVFYFAISFLLLFPSQFLLAQGPKTITGTVRDEKNIPLAGVSIQVKGSSTGTSTGTDGKYSLEVPGANSVLVVSYLGYQSREYTVGNNSTIDMSVKSESKALDEVLVTGYSKQSKRDVTGAVSTISANIIAQTPVTDVGSILQGRVAGVSVDDQGGPGNTAVVRIRGFGSIGNNNPLYVIDGVQMPTNGDNNNLINPGDIESITILKDPSITSLYGAQGGNGVIVITTKTGKVGAPKLEYNGYMSWENIIKAPKIISGQQYADAYWGYLANSGKPQSDAYYGDSTVPVLPYYLVEKNGAPLILPQGSPQANPDLYNLNNYRILQMNPQGTNWWDATFKTAFTQNHQLSLSGATDKSNYALSLNFYDNKGILISTYFRRYSLRVNTEFTPVKWLRVGENVQFSFSQGNDVQNHNPQGLIGDLYNRSPLMPMYDIAGNYSGPNGLSLTNIAFHPGGNNPVLGLTNTQENNHGYNAGFIGSAFLAVEPIKNLIFETKIGLQFYPNSYSYYNGVFPQNVYSPPYNSFSEGGGWSSDWRWTNKVSYDFRINQIHHISAFVAYEAESYQLRYSGATTPNLPYTNPNYLNLGNGIPIDTTGGLFNTVSGGSDAYTSLSIFGNINYSLMDKYLFSFVIRRDGSSKFNPDAQQWGTFPSFSAGWRISKENFMDNIHWVNDLKIRAAYGTNGNNAIPSGLYANQYNTYNYVNSYDLGGNNHSASTGVGLYQIGNANLRWETNQTTNIGFDAALFNNHLTMNFSWFNRVTKDLLAVPPLTGLEGDALAPYENTMTFANKGIELELGYNNSMGDLRYEFNVNIATYRNNVQYIDSNKDAHIDGAAYAPTHFALTRSVVGMPVSSFFGLVQTGIFQSGDEYTKYGVTEPGLNASNAAGHFIFKDLSGPNGTPDGKIDEYDRTFIGSPHPNLTYGFTLNLYYKNFDLGIFFQGVTGNKLFNYWRAYSVWPGAQEEGATDTWSTANTSAKLPIWNSNGSIDANPSSFFVEDGSYMRLKSLQLGYTFPKCKAFSRLRIYVQGFNLLTFTGYSGIDPEVSTGDPTSAGVDFGGNYPIAKKFLVGVNLGL